MNWGKLGEAIATAAVGHMLRDEMAEAYTRAMARLVVIKLVGSLPVGAFNNPDALHGAFATGGPVRCSPFERDMPEMVVPLRGLDIRVAEGPHEVRDVFINDVRVYPRPEPQWPADCHVATPRRTPRRG